MLFSRFLFWDLSSVSHTSVRRFQICVCMRSQLVWLWGAPSSPGTSPGAGSVLRQTFLVWKRSNWNMVSKKSLQYFLSNELPGCLDSFDFRQRMYQASLAMRISVSFSKLLLNWAATYRHKMRVIIPNSSSVRYMWLCNDCHWQEEKWHGLISLITPIWIDFPLQMNGLCIAKKFLFSNCRQI